VLENQQLVYADFRGHQVDELHEKQLITASEMLHIRITVILANVVVELNLVPKSSKLSKNVFVLVRMQSSIWQQSCEFKSVSFQKKPT
jgi:hypothetical protein